MTDSLHIPTDRLRTALADDRASTRLRSALAAGTHPDDGFVPVLVERSAVEPDFFVRDMMTWALTRHSAHVTVPLLLDELRSPVAQARSQALHSLSKIGDARAWPGLTPGLLADADDEVARAAWRAAVVLAPQSARPALAERLAAQLGRGGREVRLSLSRALVALGDDARSALGAATSSADPDVRAHALATEHLMNHPDDDFDAAVFEATRLIALRDAPVVDD